MRARLLPVVLVVALLGVALAARGQVGQGHDSPQRDAVRLGPTDPATAVTFALVLEQRRQADLKRYLHDVQDPGSAGYRKFMTAAQFGARFGIPAREVAHVRRVLAARGLKVTASYPQRSTLEVRGTAATVGRFLGVRFANFTDREGHRYRAPVGVPQLPRAIQGTVEGAVGLSNRPEFHPAAVPAGGLKPKDAAAAYNIAPLHRRGLQGQGQTIAILSLDSFQDEDVAAYDRLTGITGAPPVEHVPVQGGTKPGDGQIEVDLDIDVIRGVAPRAQILNYEAENDFDGMLAIFNQILADGRADIVSVSWGSCNLLTAPIKRTSIERVLQQAVAQGVSVFVASGDAGSYDCQHQDRSLGKLSVDYPSASPNVIAVGGTRLEVRQNGTYLDEAGWEGVLSQSGGGGGLDTTAARPPWQKGPGVDNSDSTGKRQIPDVSASADQTSGWFVYAAGGPHQVGGTSASSPFWAGSTVLISQLAKQQGAGKLGFVNPILYELAAKKGSPFHDVTRGGNRHYDATPGWDYATGWGSPDVARLGQQVVEFLKQRKG